MIKNIKKIIAGSLIAATSFISTSCTSTTPASGTPIVFNVTAVSGDVQLAAEIATSTALSQETVAANKVKLAQEMYSVAFAVNQTVQSGGANLNQVTALVNTIVNKNTDNTARVASGTLVNALSLYIQQQLAQNSSNITASQQAQDTILLVSAACQGIMSVTSSYVNPATTQPSLTSLAGQ